MVKSKIERVEIIKTALQKVENEGKSVDFNQFFGVFCLQLGIRRVKLVEYLVDLHDAGLIIFDPQFEIIKWKN